MKPFTIYYFQQEALGRGQQQRVEEMLAIANPQAIYLLGASQRSRRSESIFNPEAPSSRYIADCFYLLLLPEGGNKTLQQWEDQLEQSVSGFPITVLALYVNRFVSWLKEGHPFACKVQDSAPLLYKKPAFMPETGTAVIMKAQEYTTAIKLATEFMAGAELYKLRGVYKMAVFMLHQAVEQALRALLLAGTGYYANLHNIERLLRYASLVSYQLPDIFNKALPTDKQLLCLLQKAYIGARYEKDFTVRERELEVLFKKVGKVVEIGEEYLKPL